MTPRVRQTTVAPERSTFVNYILSDKGLTALSCLRRRVLRDAEKTKAASLVLAVRLASRHEPGNCSAGHSAASVSRALQFRADGLRSIAFESSKSRIIARITQKLWRVFELKAAGIQQRGRRTSVLASDARKSGRISACATTLCKRQFLSVPEMCLSYHEALESGRNCKLSSSRFG